jgi:gliding motility-associated-like protein
MYFVLCKDKLWTLKKFNFKINKNVTLSFLGRYCKHFNLRGENSSFSPLFYFPNFIPLLLLLSFYLPTHAQNLITNGSFEDGLCDPSPSLQFEDGVNSETGWLNADTVTIRCNENSCFRNEPFGQGYRYRIIVTDTQNRCCGRGCSGNFLPTDKFTSTHVAAGHQPHDSSGFIADTDYIGQQLSNPLTKGHTYYYYQFICHYGLLYHRVGDSYVLGNEYQVGAAAAPNTIHNGFGVAFTTYHLKFDTIPLPLDLEQRLLPTAPNQRKLRFTIGYQPNWRKLQGSFVADSAYTHFTIGNFWTTTETTFNPPLSESTRGLKRLFLDSVNMWDVTHNILGDTQYCSEQNAVLTSEYYSRGYTVWYNKQGDSLYTGDTFNFSITSDTFIRSIRYFPEIEYSTADSISLFVQNTTPKINLTRSTNPCTLPATFTVLPENEYTYSWNNMLGTNQYTTIDSQTIHLLVTDTNGCYFDTSFFVWPEVAFSATLLSDTCDLTAEISIEPDTYQYTVNGTSSSTRYLGNLSGRVTIIATQANGCKDTQYIAIPVCIVPEDNLWIPNAFTPNTDDLNRTFAPLSQYIKTYELNIYNRWGEHIFQSTDANPAWDGTFQNKIAQQGSYLYTVTITLINGKRIQRSGQIMLLR